MSNLPDVHMAESIPDAARAEIDRLLTSGDLFRYTAPSDSPVARLESAFAAHMGVKYAVAVASCSAALFLSLKALGLPRGAKVAIPAFTFAAVPSAVVHADCVPVLIEVADNYRIDIADLKAKIAGCDAVLISHMRGHTSDMGAILDLADAAGIPVVEDAAHSMGTTWHGKKIGTLGHVGCFSFQSYKMLNGGEGGILISDDAELMAKAVIMSGAYEHNWKKHPVMQYHFAKWQNKLPLYNTRISNLSAAVVLPQLDEVARRVATGRRNHDHVAQALNETPFFDVPPSLAAEERAPDSIQFNLVGFTDDAARSFVQRLKDKHLGAQVFGLSSDNARAFWNWQFLGDIPELPQTRAMLMRACDVRLPARLSLVECDAIVAELIDAATEATHPEVRLSA